MTTCPKPFARTNALLGFSAADRNRFPGNMPHWCSLHNSVDVAGSASELRPKSHVNERRSGSLRPWEAFKVSFYALCNRVRLTTRQMGH